MYTFLNYLLFDIEMFCYNVASFLFLLFFFLWKYIHLNSNHFFKSNGRFLIRSCLIIQYAFLSHNSSETFCLHFVHIRYCMQYNKILLVVLISLRHILWFFVYTINIKINWIELVIALSKKKALEKNFCSKDNEQVLIFSLLSSR